MSRTNRAVANCDQLEMYPMGTMSLLPWIGSDPGPLLLDNNHKKWKKGETFR